MSRGGVEHVLRHGSYTATVTEVGAGLRQLRYGEQELVRPYPGHAVRPRFSGAVLAPWPNRIVDGRYTFEGLTHQLPLTEPERNHALHGLVCWDRFSMSERSEDSVTLVDRLVPQTGYPFDLEVEVTYSLDGTGLHQAVTGRNVGNDAAPWGTAPHPYLRAGTKRVDDIVLTVPAERFLEVTPDRYLPLDLIDLDGGELDFRTPRLIGPTFVDHAYTGLRPDEDGLVRVRLRHRESSGGVECIWDPRALPWVQVHTADTPNEDTNRTGLAVEPMTCPPDAFNSGTDLVTLAAGATHTVSWTLRAVEPEAG
jgi:aldose 1-epimerase